MSLVLIAPSSTTGDWVRSIARLDPSLEVEVYPDIRDKARVVAALTWGHPHGVFKEFPNLSWVCSIGAGVDHILRDPALDPKLTITRIVDRHLSRDMKRAAVLAVLHWEYRVLRYQHDQEQKKWDPIRKRAISQIGILGMGEMGKSIAEGLLALGYRVSGFSRTEKNMPGVNSYFGSAIPGEFLKETDVLICILPNTSDSKDIINDRVLNEMKRGAYIINLGRGSHINEEALIKSIHNGQISGAWLDVFNEEPLPSSHPFWTTEGVTVMPHIASKTDPVTASEVVVENYRRLMNGEELLYKIDVERGY